MSEIERAIEILAMYHLGMEYVPDNERNMEMHGAYDNVITWSWRWVLVPTWITIVIGILAFVVVLVAEIAKK